MSIYLIGLISLILLSIVCSVQSSKVTEEYLEFIHIPKNAGTTIENVADKNGIKWGRFKPEHANHINDTSCTYWHQPPKKFNSNNYYNKDKTFCVIRDPLERMVSEYTYRNKNDPSMNDPKKMNDWIRYYLNDETISGQGMNCHFVPQYEYVFDDNGNRTCDYMLDFNNLSNDFNNLMKQENIDLKLEDKDKHNKSTFTMSVSDLDEDNIKRIREIYHKDFSLLNM